MRIHITIHATAEPHEIGQALSDLARRLEPGSGWNVTPGDSTPLYASDQSIIGRAQCHLPLAQQRRIAASN